MSSDRVPDRLVGAARCTDIEAILVRCTEESTPLGVLPLWLVCATTRGPGGVGVVLDAYDTAADAAAAVRRIAFLVANGRGL